ncbi:permease [Thiopseudomonas alkaliphila]|uniref:AmpG family muropeptide MFS transporter n=1 Tax=Thiopseudomonas alkaliphila TaxID=1697053 RepID=UPI00069F859E|nr:AmpG family muropeptide MFS transporter [Thiopseudomonas alkaliphila]AKX44631.1 permease [Thiopseudomonas alkaliphila]
MSSKAWRGALEAYANPAALALLFLGFSAGLPYMLVFSTLSVWLREAGVARETIGYASLIGLAYAFKWVWSPMLDQWRLPIIGRLGRRRSWLVFSQLVIAISLAGMALSDPKTHLAELIALAVAVAFASATQDIAVDAYRLEIADESRQAAMAASYMAGYRIAILLATAGPLYLAEWFGSTGLDYRHAAWASTYLIFALLMLPGLLTTLWMKEPALSAELGYTQSVYGLGHQLLSVLVLVVLLVSLPALATQLFNTDFMRVINGELSWLGLIKEDRALLRALLYLILSGLCLSRMGRTGLQPVLTPITDFVLRYRWQALLLIGLVSTYRMSDTVTMVMANVFYLDQGFSKDQIAGVTKVFGLIMTLLGAGLGGVLIFRFGVMPILFIGGITSAITNLFYAALVSAGTNLHLLMLIVSLDSFSMGLATSAFVAFLSSLTNLKFSATQYALLSSLMLFLPRLVGGYSGVLVEHFGYQQFFMISASLGVPTLILILWYWQIQKNG